MKNHWDKNLNVRKLLEEYQPKMVVELGVWQGENTLQYLGFQKHHPFLMFSVDDNIIPPQLNEFVGSDFCYVQGISYEFLKTFPDESVDFCSVDTDHNYWTLKQELIQLRRVMKPRGIMVVHDTESFRSVSGTMSNGYNCNFPYPNEIGETKDKGMYQALSEAFNEQWLKIIKHCPDSCGATALQKL